jgi:hypothetical protein
VAQDAKERKAKGQKSGGGDRKSVSYKSNDRSPQQIGESDSSRHTAETSEIRAKEAGTNREYRCGKHFPRASEERLTAENQ